jgi:hypothetical protein
MTIFFKYLVPSEGKLPLSRHQDWNEENSILTFFNSNL